MYMIIMLNKVPIYDITMSPIGVESSGNRNINSSNSRSSALNLSQKDPT